MNDNLTNDPFAAIRLREYRDLLLGRFLFIMGLRMLSSLVGWWIYNLTDDPFAIGLVGLAQVVPALSFSLYAGHIIDTSEKRKLLIKSAFLYAVGIFILVIISGKTFTIQYSKHTIALCIYLVIFCTGIIRAFSGPVFGVLLAYIVPRHHLQNATTWNQGTWLTASVTGHAIGGILIGLIGIHQTLSLIFSLILISIIVFLRLSPKPSLNLNSEKKTWESVVEGVQFVFKTKELLGAISLDLFAVLFGGAVAMVPVYARDILKVGPEGFGFLNGASDIGSIIIVVLLTIFPLRKNQGKTLLYAVAGFGVCIIIFGFSKYFVLSFIALLIGGMVDGVSVVIRGTITQLKTPDNMRGRVMSVNSMFINSSNELGQFESGVAAKIMGTVASVVFGGCMTLLVVGTTWFKAPSLRKMEY